MMCKKRKKIKDFSHRFEIDQRVNFKYKNEICPGIIFDFDLVENEVIYSIQIGGECPAIIKNVKEKEIFPFIRH